MLLIAVDPGSEKSGVVVFCTEREQVIRSGNPWNRDLEIALQEAHDIDGMVCERFESFGRASTFAESCIVTCYWTGRFSAAFAGPQYFVKRSICKRHLCPAGRRVGDKEVRQACLDRWGGKSKAVGTKKTGYGPLHGVKTSHQWAALALCVFWVEVIEEEEKAPDRLQGLRQKYTRAFV